VSTDPELIPSSPAAERNWLPMAIAAAIVLILAGGIVLFLEHGKGKTGLSPLSSPLDSYAASLPVSKLVMSESSSLAGSKVTYVDGVIANQGNRTVTGVTVQVLFRTFAKEVAQNDTQSMKWIRTRVPYVDVEPISAAPLAPGAQHEFRLIFDSVTPEWNGAYPEIRILHVDTK
jgi:hypothetical protein